ncbi:23S rRNA (uracil(1939)-C(5))-methyltransferase RlmD [Clostridium colicanis]|uniref:23S rRNA (Uracil-C(5))-methyltransferase RlmCD n=1 Tax=Clostridium colicanis DSM 13634 TaxID=1121305 RepID=A0A151ALW6_9CLOT|nr:23S rRNA (uracil(1939)-C(5))-methyltransferase RlmD [Clostridium colicanis]KYH28614.1 23S rRNA (uracil-C(5))-methyltransferase RlmCD [Clostridium colicanis DSM 13634]
MKRRKVYEFDIIDTEFPGVGVAYHEDGTKVLIKNALPGQKVEAFVNKKTKEYAKARLNKVIKDVDYKIEPKCPIFDLCGGCSHQFVPYEMQLKYKKEQVLKLFKEAEIENFEFLGIEGSPEIFGYRNKMEFTFGDMEKGGELTLGMHAYGKSFAIITADICKIVDSDFTLILKTVLDYFRKQGLPHYRIMSHEGYLRNLVIRKATNTGQILINLVTTSQIDFDMSEITEILSCLEYKGELKGIIHTINDSLSDVVQADSIKILYGQDYIIEDILGLKFKISPFSFFQTNSKGAEKLYSIVREFMGDAKSKIVFDLYCGTGTIGQISAYNAKKVIGIELIEEAAKAANENARLNGIDNCEFIAGDVAKVIKNIKEKPDIVILDPPRPGVHPDALKYVAKFDPEEIIYVSCNPKTLVEDLKILMHEGYKVEKVKVMDMFPHTAHVECVTLMSKVEK